MMNEPDTALFLPRQPWSAQDLTAVGVGRLPVGDDGAGSALDESGLDEDDQINACLFEVEATARGEGFLMWRRLMMICELLDLVIGRYSDQQRSREDLRVLEPYAQVAARISLVLSVGRTAAENLIDRAEAARDRIPRCGRLLRDGIISVVAFNKLVFEAAAVTDRDLLARIDADAAAELESAGAISVGRASTIMRSIVRAVDPDAARREREQAKANRDVQSWPAPGDMGTLAITGSAEEIAAAEQAVDAVADGACEHDPRTRGQRRSDAALARLRGEVFGCDCGREDCAAKITEAEVTERFARIVVHVVADGSTLEGGDKPGHLDGHGAIDAALVREIADRPGTLIRPLDYAAMNHPAQAADPYRPTATCEVFLRTLFPTCTWPGCGRPAWRCQLDHVCEFNHDQPEAGGATCQCNLNPKCVFHHLLKTFGEGWVDDQIIDANGVFWTEVTTPEGYTVRSKAVNTWLLPDLGLVPCHHPPPLEPGRVDPLTEPMRTTTRTERKHDYRKRLRAQNRRRRQLVLSGVGTGRAGGAGEVCEVTGNDDVPARVDPNDTSLPPF